MSRGDKRERDRAKNQIKQQQKTKQQAKAGNILDRNTADKLALDKKIAMKAAKKKEEELAAANTAKSNKVTRKKKLNNVELGLDDLLNAGLKKK